MLELDIHPGDYSESGECADCGGKTRTVWGYVYRDGQAHCAYYGHWTAGHIERGLRFLLSIGEWGDGTSGAQRRSVGIECLLTSGQPSCTIVDASDLPWANEELLGKPLVATTVAGDPIEAEAMSIMDSILKKDDRVQEFLSTIFASS